MILRTYFIYLFYLEKKFLDWNSRQWTVTDKLLRMNLKEFAKLQQSFVCLGLENHPISQLIVGYVVAFSFFV